MAQFTEVGVESVVKGFGGFMRDLGKMDKGIQDVGRTAGGIGKQFTGLGKSVLGVGATMAKTAVTGVAVLGGAIAGIGAVSLRAASDYESAFAGVIKTTDGLVDGMGELTELGEELSQGFRDLSKTVPVSPEQLAAIGELGGQLGISSENLLDFSETIAALDVATNLTAEEAALELARFANVMGTAQTDIDRLGSTIVNLGNNLATTERDIVSFGARIGGAGEIAGLTEADVLAIGAAMSSVGVQAEAGGTAVQKVLLAMNTAVVGGTEAMVDNSAAIEKAQAKLTDLRSQLEIANLKQSEFTDKTKASTRAANQARIDKLTRQIADQESALGGLVEAHGQLEEASGQISVFASTAGLSVEEFKQLWEEDAANAFQLFVEGLGKQGDNAIGTLEELGLQDQRLIRSFLSLAGAGDLLGNSLEIASEGWEENTALSKEAEARYGTFESQVQLLKNSLHDIAITVGQPLLKFFADLIKKVRPIIDDFGKKLPAAIEIFIDMIRDMISGVENLTTGGVLKTGVYNIVALFTSPEIAQSVADFAANIFEGVQSVIQFLSQAFAFLRTNVFPIIVQAIQFVIENWDAFKAAIIAIGAILAGAAIAAAITGIATAIASLFSPIGIIIAVVAALAAAWSSNFLGIRDILTEFWENTGRPIFEQIIEWLQINIPIAIQALAAFWTGTLQPALATVWGFIQNVLIPVLAILWDWLSVTIPAALQALATFWQTVLLPAIRIVWGFIQDNVIPLLAALANVYIAVVKKELELLAGIWQNIVLPALRIVWSFLNDFVIPILAQVGGAIGSVLGPIIEGFVAQELGNMIAAFEAIGGAIQAVIGFLNDMATRISEIQLPEFLQPGSPTPFEMGLRGIGETLSGTVIAALVQFATSAAAAFNNVEQQVMRLRERINNVSAITLPKLMTTAMATAQQMVTSFTSVIPIIERLTQALMNIYEVVLLQLENVTRETTISMASSFQSVIPSVTNFQTTITTLTNKISELGTKATSVAGDMKQGFIDAQTEVGNLISELGRLIDKFNEVRRAAEAAASAAASVGTGEATGEAAFGTVGTTFSAPPVFTAPPGGPGAVSSYTRQNIFNLNVSTRATAQAVIDEFEVMTALVGG